MKELLSGWIFHHSCSVCANLALYFQHQKTIIIISVSQPWSVLFWWVCWKRESEQKFEVLTFQKVFAGILWKANLNLMPTNKILIILTVYIPLPDIFHQRGVFDFIQHGTGFNLALMAYERWPWKNIRERQLKSKFKMRYGRKVMDSPQRTYFPMFDQDTLPPAELAAPQLCRMLGGQRRNPEIWRILNSSPNHLLLTIISLEGGCKSWGIYISVSF